MPETEVRADVVQDPLSSQAEALGRQGWACQQREKLAEALEHYRQALTLLETAENRPAVASDRSAEE